MTDLISGRNAVTEALRASQRPRRILVDQGARTEDRWLADILKMAREGAIPVERVARQRLDAIHPRHQGVVAEIDEFNYRGMGEVKQAVADAGATALVLALDTLQDPQNFGTLLRTALAVSVTAVLIPEHRAVGVTPAVVRVSAGATEHLPIARVPNLVRALDELKKAGLWVVGLDAHDGQAYDAESFDGPLALVVGSEGSGLRRLVKEHCDILVHLPMAGQTESLNAAVAGSIALYHVFRERTRAAQASNWVS